MNPIATQQAALDNALVPPEKRLKIERCNARIAFNKPQREETYQVTLEALKLSLCYLAFVITAKVPKIYMHQFWTTIKKIRNSDAYNFKLEKKKNLAFLAGASLGKQQDLIDSGNHKLKSCRYGPLIPNDMINQDIKDSEAYKTYYDFATGKVPPRKARKYKKVVSPSRKLSPVKEAEYDKKDKRFMRTIPESLLTAQQQGFVIRDTPGVSVSNKKAPAKADRSKVAQEESSTQAPSLFTVLEMAILETSTAHATTFPPTISMITPLPQLTTPSPAPTTVPTTTSIPENLAFVLSDFATPVIHSTINESLENVILAKSSSQPKSTYEAAESLTEELYEGLVKSYNLDKDLFSSYGNVYSLNRDHDDKDKDEDPFAGSDRGLKKRKTSKNAEPPKGSKSKESKTSSSKGTKSQPKSSGKSVQAKEPVFETADTEMPQDQGGDTEDQSNVDTTPMDDWFKKPNKPLNPDRAWNDGKSIDSRPPQKWISNIAKARQPPRTFDELMSTPIDFSAYVMHNLKIDNLTQEILVGPAFNLLKGTCKSFVELV
ncbi:hypothetical protein Tco_0750837 [Tanacetum coccineum]|uniref:Uncharacterized protein n=1 Tax=Tanacetum coccineum TaxID=301880 RepID=A0ABQ4Z3T8_9ASTR